MADEKELRCVYCNNSMIIRERRISPDTVHFWGQCGSCSATSPVAESRLEALRLASSRYVCPDISGEAVYEGDEVECCGARGKIVRFGCGYVIERDGKFYQLLSGKIELIKKGGGK